MKKITEQIIGEMASAIAAVLDDRPDGLTELELIKQLQDSGVVPPSPDLFQNTLQLFKIHFLVFHCLYRLRDHMRGNGSGDLHIHTLQIRRLPYTTGKASLADLDPLHHYYMDLEQLDTTGESDVMLMLERFWRGSERRDQRKAALSLLGLEDPVDERSIKARYRRLAMRHHPDRGGDGRILQEINWAVRILTP